MREDTDKPGFRRAARIALLAVIALLTSASIAAALPSPVNRSESLAIAAFSGTLARPGHDPRDVTSVLASALGAASTIRVVSPALAADALVEPSARDVRRFADRNRVDHVVVGRADGMDVAVELRSGHSGVALAEYRLAPASQRELTGAVRRLALLILADLGEQGHSLTDTLPPVSAPAAAGEPDEASAVAEAKPVADDGLALLPGPRRDDPISINSDELEVLPEAGGRRLVFSRNVEVLQGDVKLNADRLEAIYPQGSSQPETLLATGHVRVHQGDRRARCERATYQRSANTIVCRGKAEITQGCDRVRGEEIEFDLTHERVRVSGAASVVIQSEDEDAGTCPDGSSEPEPGS